MCSLRMWTYGLTYVMVWGSLALKTYRVKTLVVDQADQHSQMADLTDGKLLLRLAGLLVIEIVILCLYSFVGKPLYVNAGG